MHRLESEYGLTSNEILDAIDSRFRAKVALEGAIAEVQLEKKLAKLKAAGVIHNYLRHDRDGYPDFTIIKKEKHKGYLVECKNIRNRDEAFRRGGEIYAYKVETQKTRTSQGDPSSRFYGIDLFEILAVCLGKKTHKWDQFMFIKAANLTRHEKYPKKIAVMHQVPLPDSKDFGHWFPDLAQIIDTL
jgi:hypothetical protein